jgi:signal transduction histidine kinase
MLLSKNTRWPWLVCLILFAGFLVNSISSYKVARSNLRLNITESTLPLTSDNVYSEIQRDLLNPIFISSLMANDTFLRDWVIDGETDINQITKFLNEIKIQYSTITSFFVSEKTRNYYYAHGLLKQIKENSERDAWYFEAKAANVPYEINVDPDMANEDTMTIFINHRVLDYAGELIGMAGVGLTVNKVNHLISSYEAKYDRQIYFVDAEGNIVVRPSNSPLLQYRNFAEIPQLATHTEKLLSKQLTKTTYEREGKTYMLNCRYVPELDWFLVVEQSENAMLEPIREQFWFNIILALTLTAIIAWIFSSVVKSTQQRIEQRNIELTQINHENEIQKKKLELTADQLTATNEKLSVLNKEKDEFISIIAHDLRNPLNGILGLCQLAEDDDRDAVQFDHKSFVADIQDCGERMLELTQSLLDVSRIEAFQGQVEMKTVDCNAIIKKSLEEFKSSAARKKITLDCKLTENIHHSIQSMPDWLSICLNNILSNAIKYTPIGGKVTLSSHNTQDGVEIRTHDNGPGISPEEQKKLFTKFTRLSARPTNNETTTGLGLYLVKSMCERLNITIRVESELGQGSTFILCLNSEPSRSDD